jgi:hypothetical protein
MSSNNYVFPIRLETYPINSISTYTSFGDHKQNPVTMSYLKGLEWCPSNNTFSITQTLGISV